MPTPDDLEYALEQTRILLSPERRIETFGRTHFHFHVITELMDRANEIRIRSGQVHAERPGIVSPETFARLLLEGFGDKAMGYAHRLEADLQKFAVLKYGFVVRKSDLTESIVHDHLDAVAERILTETRQHDPSTTAVIQGVDDVWEISLLRFTWDLVRNSAEGNLGDLRGRGLL